MIEQPFLIGEGWLEVKDGDPTAHALFSRHYSRRSHERKRKWLIVGPGEKFVLITPCARALFVWRRARFKGQGGVNCAVFRNEGAGLSSDLIRDADGRAFERWPGERHFTFVDAEATATRRSARSEPGACFIHAGWRPCGMTKERGYHILERLP